MALTAARPGCADAEDRRLARTLRLRRQVAVQAGKRTTAILLYPNVILPSHSKTCNRNPAGFLTTRLCDDRPAPSLWDGNEEMGITVGVKSRLFAALVDGQDFERAGQGMERHHDPGYSFSYPPGR